MDKLIDEIMGQGDEKDAKHLMYFFKTGKGEYGEGDKFLGLRVPATRSIAKKHFNDLNLNQIEQILHNEYHEIRLCALLMFAFKFEKESESGKKEIFDLYSKNTKFINNWDLVDLSCPKIIGEYLIDKDKKILNKLSVSNSLWDQRISIVSTFAFIKKNKFDSTLELAESFLDHKHDLIHKASGWMLREAGKRDKECLLGFLNKHYKIMPRTMLRYSIEKLEPELKKHYMKKEV